METILLTIVIFTGIIVVTYIILYNNIQAFNIKINEAESIIDDLLRKKYDNLDNMKSIILKETDLPEQTFEVFEKIKNVNISSFDLDRKLIEANIQFITLKEKYKELKESEEIQNISKKLEELDEKLEVNRDYYNNNIAEYNKLIKMFPTNIIARLCKYEEKLFFDRKDMSDDDYNDFKL